MAARLAQAPLPWLPEGAEEVAPGVGLVPLPDGGGVVWVHGLATFCWEAGDQAGRRLAAVQLTELKGVLPGESRVDLQVADGGVVLGGAQGGWAASSGAVDEGVGPPPRNGGLAHLPGRCDAPRC